jgi:hypothetical protein
MGVFSLTSDDTYYCFRYAISVRRDMGLVTVCNRVSVVVPMSEWLSASGLIFRL